ncbi:molybdopterin-containing oxidoreductase family protein [Paracoccus lichenicola]|nr:molybdopterin-dependent oxidoreductase [Paracoccus lichenicola]
MPELKHSFCRCCINQCSINVIVEDGRVLAVEGNPDNPQYKGYSCIKGRSQAAFLTDKNRLLHPLRRRADGTHEAVSSDAALNEIAEKLKRIKDRFGPRAIASYWGTMASIGNPGAAMPFYNALLDAIGTNMRFDPNTIDKGGKQTAQSFLGYWGAPSRGFDRPDAILLIGINPLLTYTGFPAGSPKRWIADMLQRDCKLIVIDPRETQIAQRATHFLQARPGWDVQILAAFIKVILDEELYDAEFVARHVTGVRELASALDSLDIAAVAQDAGVDAKLIVEAARAYAGAKRGYAMAGTGPHMSGFGTLVEYLTIVIDTLCGRWMRAGETILPSPSLLPAYTARAEARPPDADWALAGRLRVRGLKQSRAGMPTAALAEEMLLPGKGQVKALISWGGNPAVAYPDQERVIRALTSLDLFVTVDPWYSESAKLAHYVLPPMMGLEVEAATIFMDWVSGRATGYGQGLAHAQHTEAIVPPPEGSDLLEDWEIFYELLVRMGYRAEVLPFGSPPDAPKLQFDSRPTSSRLLERLTERGRIPLQRIKGNPGGHVYDEDLIVVEPGDPANSSRLDVGHAEMMRWLTEFLNAAPSSVDDAHEYRLLCRRQNHVYNSSCHNEVTHKGRPYNPAFLNPEDMAELEIAEGDEIRISSELGVIRGLAHADRYLIRKTLSMSFAYGRATDPTAEPAIYGANPNRLIPSDQVFDPYTGQPRMTNVPVSIAKAG